MSQKNRRGLATAYEVVTERADDGKMRSRARFVCQGPGCEKIYDHTIRSGEPLNSMAMVNKMRAEGWAAHHINVRDTYCPQCLALAKAMNNDTNSELKKLEMKMSAQPAAPQPDTAPQKETVVALTPMTADQRVKMRHLLEGHFDEGIGCYTDGWSDQTIAENVGVARVHVEKMREAAYGPIRITEQQKALFGEMKQMAERIENNEKKIRQLFDQLAALDTANVEQKAALNALMEKAKAA